MNKLPTVPRKLKKWAINVLIALDRLANALLGGDRDMTVSGRMGIAIAQGRCKLCRPVCWALHMFDRNHCARVGEQEKAEGNDEVVRW